MSIRTIWQKVKCYFAKPEAYRNDQCHVMTREEMLDETIDDSFPASDPPGHFSKSVEDYRSH